jgi:hypothetical protein
MKLVYSFNFVTFKDKKSHFVGETVSKNRYRYPLAKAIQKYPDCSGIESFYAYSIEERERLLKRIPYTV